MPVHVAGAVRQGERAERLGMWRSRAKIGTKRAGTLRIKGQQYRAARLRVWRQALLERQLVAKWWRETISGHYLS